MLSVQKSVHIFSVSSKTSGKFSENNVDIKRKNIWILLIPTEFDEEIMTTIAWTKIRVCFKRMKFCKWMLVINANLMLMSIWITKTCWCFAKFSTYFDIFKISIEVPKDEENERGNYKITMYVDVLKKYIIYIIFIEW